MGLGGINPYTNDINMNKYVLQPFLFIRYPIGIEKDNYIALAIAPSWGLPYLRFHWVWIPPTPAPSARPPDEVLGRGDREPMIGKVSIIDY